jgi:hypothetical protein
MLKIEFNQEKHCEYAIRGLVSELNDLTDKLKTGKHFWVIDQKLFENGKPTEKDFKSLLKKIKEMVFEIERVCDQVGYYRKY